jgi:hypothetical protein
VQLQFVQIGANRTIHVAHYAHLCGLGRVGRSRSTPSAHPLRAQNENGLPKARLTRERGARESRASGLSRARALTRTCSRQPKFGSRKVCRLPRGKVQPEKVKLSFKLSFCRLPGRKVRARSGQRLGC